MTSGLGVITEVIQMAHDTMPFCHAETKIELDGKLYELWTDYSPEFGKDGEKTKRRILHLKLTRLA